MSRISTEPQDNTNPTYVYVSASVDGVTTICGVRNVVICPGSRSTPLAMTLAAQSGIRLWMHIDERSSSVLWARYGKASSATCCFTVYLRNGSSKFYASDRRSQINAYSLASTDSRPPSRITRLWCATGYRPESTLWFPCEMVCRCGSTRSYQCSIALYSHYRRPGSRAHTSNSLSDPFISICLSASHSHQKHYPTNLCPHQHNEIPSPGMGTPTIHLISHVNDTSLTSASATEIRHLTNTLSTTPRGLIIAGPYDSPALAAPLIQMAHRLGYPILADPLSQLRCGDL